MTNRVSFRCLFHEAPAEGRLTFEEEGRFICTFIPDGERKVVWPFQGRWSRYDDTVLLTTPHSFVDIVLTLNPDQTLSFGGIRGGFVRLNLVGARTTPLLAELRNSACPASQTR